MKEMDDRRFLDYCLSHSETSSALFSGTQIERILRLAGHEETANTWKGHGNLWRSCDLSGLVDEARERLNAKKDVIEGHVNLLNAKKDVIEGHGNLLNAKKDAIG